MKMIHTDFVILGAGLSGAVAADLLIKKGKKVCVLEKQNKPGGLARTLRYDAFKFDIGGHRLCVRDAKTLSYLKSISNNNLLQLKTKCKILFNGRFIDYPPSLKSIFMLEKKYLLKICKDMVRNKKNVEINSFEDWVKYHYGNTLFDTYFKEYSKKVWGLNCEELSYDWAERRIGRTLFSLGNQSLRLESNSTKEYISRFFYPAHGIGEIIDNLIEKKDIKSVLYTGANINGIKCDKNKNGTLEFLKNGQRFKVKFKEIISTIPLKDLVHLIKISDQSKEIGTLINKVRYRNLILVAIVLKRKRATPFHWIYIPDKDVIFSRVYEPKNWSDKMSSCNDKTLVCFEIFCSPGDRIWNLADEEITQQVKDDFKKLLSVNGQDIANSVVKRFNYAYPLFYLGYSDHLRHLLFHLSRIDNLYLLGRSGTHSYYDMEECIDSTRSLIETIC